MIRDFYKKFIGDFLRLFTISNNGSVKANWNILEEIEAWISNEDIKLLLLEHYLDLNGVVFNRGNINANKCALWQIYSICFIIYIRFCRLFKIDID